MELRVLVGGIRRAAWLIALLAVIGLLIGLQVGGGLTARAQASMLLDPSAAAASGIDAADRFIEDQVNILTSRPIAEAAAALAEDASPSEIAGSLSAEQRIGSNIVDLSATAATEERAVAIVDAVAAVYLQRPRPQEETRTERMAELEAELDEIQEELVAVQAQLVGVEEPPAELSVQQDVLQRRYDQLLPQLVSMRFTEIPPDRTALIEPASPVEGGGGRSGLSALLGALLGAGLGVAISSALLVASPRIVDGRYAEYLLGLPTAATIPLRRGRGRREQLGRGSAQPLRRLTALINGTPVLEPPRRVAVCQPSADRVTGPIARSLAAAYAGQGLEAVHVSLTAAADDRTGRQGSEVAPGWTSLSLGPHLQQWVPRPGHPVSVERLDRMIADLPGADVVVFDLGVVFEHEAALAVARTADDIVLVAPLWSPATNELRLIRESLVEPDPARAHLVLTTRRWTGERSAPDGTDDRSPVAHG